MSYIRNTAGKFSTELAIGSFAIGTVFFILAWIFPRVNDIFLYGLIYIVLALLLNGLMLLHLAYFFITSPREREYLAIKMLILLSNVPIAILYIYVLLGSIKSEF